MKKLKIFFIKSKFYINSGVTGQLWVYRHRNYLNLHKKNKLSLRGSIQKVFTQQNQGFIEDTG